MKAGLAVNLAVARALHRSGRAHRAPAGPAQRRQRGGRRPRAPSPPCAAATAARPPSSPSRPAARLVTANAGALTFRIEVAGRAAHGSTRHEGVSALEVFWPVHLAPARARGPAQRRPAPALRRQPAALRHLGRHGARRRLGQLGAGPARRRGPDGRAAGRGARASPAPRFEDAVAAAAAADPWLRDHPPRVTWPGGQFASRAAARRAPARSARWPTRWRPSPAPGPPRPPRPTARDLRLYTGVGGIPTLHYGPGDVRLAHAPRESVPIAEVVEVARSLALVAARRLGAH